MVNPNMLALGQHRSAIREIFEYGNRRAAEIGRENLFDFSLGNPSVPAPDEVRHTAVALLERDPVWVHGYTSAPGDAGVRQALADDLNRRFGTAYTPAHLYLTAGAAAALMCTLRALACAGDEFVVLAPYFPEYRAFIEHGAGARCVIVPAQTTDFGIDLEALARSLTEKTKAVLINSPNNPSGVVYSADTLRTLATLLSDHAERVGHPIYLISDEPYREIVYDGLQVPFVPQFYRDTIVCYSYSKSLSLPGERIGYVLLPTESAHTEQLIAAVAGAGRSLGYVCAPSLFQRVAAQCASLTSDLSVYRTCRDLLYNGLTQAGYRCVKPQGAFYLLPQTPLADDYAFCEKAKAYDLLVVPGTEFGAPGHMRISYCVQPTVIERALPRFARLLEDCQS